MSATDGSELTEGRIIYIGDNHCPSGRMHYVKYYLIENPHLIEEEIVRMNSKETIDDLDSKYLKRLQKLAYHLNEIEKI